MKKSNFNIFRYPAKVVPSPFSKKAVTLVELIVAAIIITTVATGFLVVFVSAKKTMKISTHKLQAIGVAKDVFEGLKTEEYANLVDGTHPISYTQDDPRSIFNPVSYTVATVDDFGGRPAKKVTVTVNWTEVK